VQRDNILWRFGPGKPSVNAHYLLDAAMVFPDADKLFWNTLITPLMIQSQDGDGLILPVRVAGETQQEPASDEESKAVADYEAKQEANRQEIAERTKAICEAHNREHEANVAMDEAAARWKTLEEGVKNASNDALKSGLMEQLADAQREYAKAAFKRHQAILDYDPEVYINADQFEFLVKLLYGINAA
jgi:hypothetical protein